MLGCLQGPAVCWSPDSFYGLRNRREPSFRSSAFGSRARAPARVRVCLAGLRPSGAVPGDPMKSFFRLLALAAMLVVAALPLAADEGMWMPQQIPDLAEKLRAMGFEGDPAAFADLTGQPMGAIVSLGGCTASFVSPEGLIATNHHCVQGSLQYNSTPQRNLLVDGFLAKTREEELWNGPGSRVYVTHAVREVTDAITGKIDPKLDDRKRFDLVERRVKERVAACEAGGFRCRVDS